jgi:Domain of unknown function (DUF4258)
MSQFRLIFRVHAIQRMFQRRISEEEVKHVVAVGEIVEAYPEDKPFPSRLMLGWIGSRPVHVVVADNVAAQEAIIVTVYQPDAEEWETGFKRRKRR